MVTTAEDYRAAAEGVVAQLREDLGVELNYDEQSIEWLDGYINRIRTQLDKETYSGLAAALGAYVGETIIAMYGGAWHYFEEPGQWGVQLPDGIGAFPSAKILPKSATRFNPSDALVLMISTAVLYAF